MSYRVDLAAPQLPAVGDTFAARIVAVDDRIVLVAVPGFREDTAIGVLKAANIGGHRYRAGNAVLVEVTGVRVLGSGRAIVELKPRARPRSQKK